MTAPPSTAALYSLACVRCKRQKVKCDRTLPHCLNCQKSSHDCVYPAAASKPGPKPGTSRRRPRSPTEDTPEALLRQTRFAASNDVQTLEVASRHKHPRVEEPPPSPSCPDGRGGHAKCPLSLLVHPTTDPAGDGTYASVASFAHKDPVNPEKFVKAMEVMGISSHETLRLVDLFFDNMVTFSLFHKPTFHRKIASIDSVLQVQALLMSIFAMSRRYVDDPAMTFCGAHSSSDILQKACDLNEACLNECEDEIVPLVVVQSTILVTFLKLAHGIRSRAWRMLGTCIRSAYELELHLEDASKDPCNIIFNDRLVKPTSNIDKEERRRTWWAIWEADVFASNMRRLPTSIDPYLNKTNLPCTDADWFEGKASSSCYLAVDPVRRWKDIADCGNRSPRAWSLLVFSYKHDAFLLSSAPDVFYHQCRYQSMSNPLGEMTAGAKANKMRELLHDCLKCAHGAMPREFVFSERYLSFSSAIGTEGLPMKTLDATRYNIHLMVHLTVFMLYRRDVYRSAAEKKSENASTEIARRDVALEDESQKSWDRYLHAAAAVSSLVRNSAPTAHRFVNPWLSNVLWYSAAAQIITGLFGPPSVNAQLISSNYELLRSILIKYVDFWGVPRTLMANLDSLGGRVERMIDSRPTRCRTRAEKRVSSLATPSMSPSDTPLVAHEPAKEMACTVGAQTYTGNGEHQQPSTTSPPSDGLPHDGTFQPDMFQSMLTDDFMDEMLNSNAWTDMDFDVDDLFFDPLVLQTPS